MEEITQEALKKIIHYCPETGVFHRINKSRPWPIKSTPRWTGVVSININGKVYLAHRLAWLYIHGNFPPNYIDHINGDASDNRLCNLREATHAENMQNQRHPNVLNQSGYLGVSWSKSNRKWYAQIKVNKKAINLGHFDDAKEAHLAYLKAKAKYHPFQTIAAVE